MMIPHLRPGELAATIMNSNQLEALMLKFTRLTCAATMTTILVVSGLAYGEEATEDSGIAGKVDRPCTISGQTQSPMPGGTYQDLSIAGGVNQLRPDRVGQVNTPFPGGLQDRSNMRIAGQRRSLDTFGRNHDLPVTGSTVDRPLTISSDVARDHVRIGLTNMDPVTSGSVHTRMPGAIYQDETTVAGQSRFHPDRVGEQTTEYHASVVNERSQTASNVAVTPTIGGQQGGRFRGGVVPNVSWHAGQQNYSGTIGGLRPCTVTPHAPTLPPRGRVGSAFGVR